MNKKQMRQKPGSVKRQAGIMGLTLIEVVAAISFMLVIGSMFIVPIIKNGNETAQATKIILGFSQLSGAANSSSYATENDFTGISIPNVVNHLPENYSVRAANGQDYSLEVNSNPTKYDMSLSIPNERIRERVMAQFNPSQYTVAGTTFTLVGP